MMRSFILLSLLGLCSAGSGIEKVYNSFNVEEQATGRAEINDDVALDKIRNDLKAFDPMGQTTMGNIPADAEGNELEAGIVVSAEEYKEDYREKNVLGYHLPQFSDQLSAKSQQATSTKRNVGASTIELIAAAAVGCVAAAVVASVMVKQRRLRDFEQETPMVATL
jgi:hypothetical protein